ncbi:MAG: DMT family transporter [Steroidobacteraceae bacterium]
MNSSSQSQWLKAHHFFLLVCVNLIWGINLLTVKFGVREIPPVLFASLRVGIMLPIFLPWLRWFPGQMLNLLCVGLGTGVAGFGLLSLGLSLSKDVSTVAIFTQLVVPFSALLSVWMLGEVIHWRRKTGIALAFCGVIIIGFDPRAFSYLPGLLLVVLQCAGAALGMIYVKRLNDISPMQLQAWISIITFPVLLSLSLLIEQDQVAALHAASMLAWGTVLFAAIGSSLIGQSAFFYLLKRYPVSSVAPLTVLSTVFGMLAGVVFNHDHLTGRMLIGGTITIVGVLIIELRTQRMAADPA